MNKTLQKEEIQFNLKLGALISGEIFKDYVTLLSLEYGGQNGLDDKYITNLCNDLNKRSVTLIKNLGRDIINNGTKEAIQEEIQRNFDVIYDTLALSFENQNRVKQLVNKLKKEELNKN